ncbi:MAG TPA: hypothetical protein VFA48_06835, partial [Gammaproteobacteria bacterium]|nr:hypothetical protein [Gammaproteobacteria bacterium]
MLSQKKADKLRDEISLRKPLKVATHSTSSLPPGPEQGCHPPERSDAGFLLLLRSRGVRQRC